MKTKTFTVHHIMEGKWFIDMIREIYWFELDRTRAMKWFDSLKPRPSEELIQKLLNGDARIVGWTICGKKSCSQCKGKTQIRTEIVNCSTFKQKLAKHKKYLKEYFYTFGSGELIFIRKSLIQEWTSSLFESKEFKFLRRSKVLAYGYKTKGSDYIKEYEVKENAFKLEYSHKAIYNNFDLDQDEEYLIASPKGMLALELSAYLDNLKFQITDDYKKFVKQHRKELRDSKATDIEASFGMRMLERSSLET